MTAPKARILKRTDIRAAAERFLARQARDSGPQPDEYAENLAAAAARDLCRAFDVSPAAMRIRITTAVRLGTIELS